MTSTGSGGDAGAAARPSLVASLGVVPLGCVIGILLLLAGGSLTWRVSPSYGHGARATSRDLGRIPDGGPGSGSSASGNAGAPSVSLSPTRIEIPKLHASAPIVPVATSPDGELDIPLDPRTVGWWSPGAKPGAKTGTAILAGHINYNGVTGTLADIGSLNPGDEVRIYGKYNADGKRADSFTVAAVRTYHKTSLPYQQIFDQASVGRLAIVTCGGPFDAATGNYLDNIVVFAVPN